MFGKLFWDLFPVKKKSYFPGNKVAFVQKFGKSRKIHFLIKFEFTHFLMKKSCYEVELKVIENKKLYTTHFTTQSFVGYKAVFYSLSL